MDVTFKTIPQLQLPVLSDESIVQLHTEGALFVDVRTREEVLAGTLPGSLHIELQTIPGRVGELQQWKDKPVVLFCKSGGRSDSAAAFLRAQGFLHAWNAGGYTDIVGLLEQAER
jgi:rhodanese-related sulfurtransferase